MGGGTLRPGLCTLPKGGAACDCKKHGSHVPIPCGRLLTNREPNTSGHKLAWYKLGADAGAYAAGCQRRLSSGKRGGRSAAYADGARNATTSTSAPWLVVFVSGRRIVTVCANSSLRQSRQYRYDDVPDRRRPAAQQSATVSCGIYLEADGVISAHGKGWTA